MIYKIYFYTVIFFIFSDVHGELSPEITKKLTQKSIPIVILGSGVAGLSAGLYAARGGFDAIVIEGDKPGGQITDAGEVDNWPGMPPLSGRQAVTRLRKQAQRFGVRIMHGSIAHVDFSSWPFKLTTAQGKVLYALTVILALGATPRKLKVEGEKLYWSKGVLACSLCDAPLSKEQDVFVVHGDELALEHVSQLAAYARSITLLVGPQHKVQMSSIRRHMKQFPNVKLMIGKKVKKFVGNGNHLSGVVLEDIKTGRQTLFKTKLAFLSLGFKPNVKLVKRTVTLTPKGCIKLFDGTQRTSKPGVFAAGNVSDCRYRQAGVAAGDGSKAALDAISYLAALGFSESIARPSKHVAQGFYTNTQATTQKNSIIEINGTAQFKKQVLQAKKPVLVKFYSPTCPHCIAMKPIIASVAHTFGNKLKVVKVDITKSTLASKFGVQGVPYFIMFKHGKPQATARGQISERKLTDFIKHSIA